MPDQRPQAENENDEAREETYIDAFNLNLRHDVTDIYVPVPGSDLTLSVRRNLASDIFTDNGGLRPWEDPGKPFGVNWSSNVCSYVKVVRPEGPDPNNFFEPVRAYVTDENGQTHSFVQYGAGWFPLPSSSHEARAYLTTLEESATHFLFTQKHGNKLRFEKVGATQTLANDRVEGSQNSQVLSYARLTHVTDRLGYQLIYSYANGSTGLIPEKIAAHRKGTEPGLGAAVTAGNTIPGLQLWLQQDALGRVTQVWDPDGNTVSYAYNTGTVLTHQWRYFDAATGEDATDTATLSTLNSVTHGDGSSTQYAYAMAEEPDYTPRNPDDVSTKPGQYQDPPSTHPQDGLAQHIEHMHVNLTAITDANGNTYGFDYGFDHSRETFVFNSVTAGYHIQTGSPRYVKKVTLPIGSASFTLGNNTAGSRLRIETSGDGYENAAINGTKTNVVKDAEGAVTTYLFEGIDIEILKQFRELAYPDLPDTKYKDPRILYYTTMRIRHGQDAKFSEEVFTFNKTAGLALASARDLSGNTKSYAYGNPLTPPVLLAAPWTALGLYGRYDDPTLETQSVTGHGTITKTYTYDDTFRKMTSQRITGSSSDVKHTRHTETTIDSYGRPTAVAIKDHTGATIQLTNYVYDGTDPVSGVYDHDASNWPGFVIKQEVVDLDLPGDPAWAVDLVTDYLPDVRGRVHTATTYPGEDAGGQTLAPLVTTTLYDFNGNVRLVTDPKGQATGFDYDVRNRLTRVTNTDDTYTQYTYDARGNRVLVRDENNHLTGYEYDALNRVVKTVRDMNGNLGYHAGSKLLTGVDGDDLITASQYNLVNSVVYTAVADGATTRFGYDNLQRLTSTSVLAADNPGLDEDIVSTFKYGQNAGGSVFNVSGFKPTLSVGPRGERTMVQYDQLYRPVRTRVEYEPAKFATTGTVYDLVGNPTQVTDPLGKVTATAYDALNRPTTVTLPQVMVEGLPVIPTIETFYTSTGLPWKVVDERNKTTQTVYDGAGRPIKVLQPLVGYVDGSGNWVESPAADDLPETRTFYDAAGNVEKTVNPLGNVWQYTYDLRNRQIRETLPAVPYIDETGNWQSTPITPEIVTAYDDAGNVTSVTDARGYVTNTVYDAANRPTHVFTPGVDYWDGVNITAVNHLATRSVYDRAGNVTGLWQGHAGTPTAAGFTGTRQSADNTYDALGRLLSTTDAASITVSNAYDAAGNLVRVTDGKNQVTSFAYDFLNRNTATVYDAGGAADTTVLAYDALNQVSRTDPNGKVTRYAYDDHHRLEHVTYLGASGENRTYAYDAAGNILTVTEPDKAAATDAAYTYDNLGRIATETSAGYTHRYRYDKAGNRRETVYDLDGSQRTLTATYDAHNRTGTIIEGTRSTTYRYDQAGNIRETIQANGDTVKCTYDALGRKTEIDGPWAGFRQLYHIQNYYDLYGNLGFIVESGSGGQLLSRGVGNTYDGADRLTRETTQWEPGGPQPVTTIYTYDDAHNRTSKQVYDDSVLTENLTYTYGNALNQLKTVTEVVSGRVVTFKYDANGNRVSKTVDETGDGPLETTVHYAYDRENRLVELTQEGGAGGDAWLVDIFPGADGSRADHAAQARYYTNAPDRVYRYAYDYRTRRVLRDESGDGAGGASTRITFSGGTSVQEYDNSATTPAVEYIRGSDYGGGVGGILYTLRSGSPSFKHYNSRGDVVAATDGTGAITWQAAYEAFGEYENNIATQSWGSTLDRQKSNTKDRDPHGLVNEGFRYRDLETGTFLTRDPLGFVDGPNVYTYVNQNPWTKFDPLGLWETGSYWGDVGEVFKGYGTSIKNTAVGVWEMSGPKQAYDLVTGKKWSDAKAQYDTIKQELPKVVDDPAAYAQEKATEVINETKEKLSTNRGQGELLGYGLQAIIAKKLSKTKGKGDGDSSSPSGPTAKEISGNNLPDDAPVVRGGTNKPEQFTGGSGVTTDSAGNIQGVSVNSAPGKTVAELSKEIPHNKVGTTTVGDVRKAGGDVVPSPTKNNQNHATMGGVTAEKASELMNPVIKNPSKE